MPLVAGTIAICLLLGERLLPQRRARSIPPDLSLHARTLVDQYAIDEDVLGRHQVPTALPTRDSAVAEVVIPPRSELVGARFFPGMVTSSGDFVVLAVQRKGQDREGDTELAVGDTILLQGTWATGSSGCA